MNVRIIRVTGALVEILEVGNRGVPTTLNEAFEVEEGIAQRLLGDGTGRFVEE